ncbi:MAG: hypothetical protein IJU29_04160, partial [Oscillospiraceae bacterium]|nr:hypothetical protein [Oscillospiraceae bacterium]
DWRANFVSAKAQKPQEYFVYFKVFATQAGAKFAVKRAWRFIQRFLNCLRGREPANNSPSIAIAASYSP